MRLLDRYVIRNFLQVYIYCIAGFLSVWLIFDVSDNISTFIDEHFGFMLTVRYYATQVPEVFVILLPVSLLLALLFVLGRMSRSNEIVSMLTAGVSIPRVLAPLIGMGLLTVAGSFALNYALAPHAEMRVRTKSPCKARFSAIAPICAPGSCRVFVPATMFLTTCKYCSRTITTISLQII